MYKKIYHIKEPSKKDLIYKQIFDFILSFFVLIIISPLFLMLGVLVKVTSNGPVIFKQKRIGYKGKEFIIYKFRTMTENAEDLKKSLFHLNESDGPVFKIENDPRITKIGRILRKTGLDELPQFFNVLKGDMSIVGPRPALKHELKCYKKSYKVRLFVKPGITCIWQIQKNRNDISFQDWMKMDAEYVKNWSLKQDIIIIFKTFKVVLKMEGR